MSRHPSPRRSYGSYGNPTGGPRTPHERDQQAMPPSPSPRAYKPGWCANGTSACSGEVAPTQLEIGGPTYPICKTCNTQEAEYRDDFRGYDVEDERGRGDFKVAVSRAYARTVPAVARGAQWWLSPRCLKAAGGES